jgi:hypothetical protein
MLTGRRAFDGEDVSEILGSVLKMIRNGRFFQKPRRQRFAGCFACVWKKM